MAYFLCSYLLSTSINLIFYSKSFHAYFYPSGIYFFLSTEMHFTFWNDTVRTYKNSAFHKRNENTVQNGQHQPFLHPSNSPKYFNLQKNSKFCGFYLVLFSSISLQLQGRLENHSSCNQVSFECRQSSSNRRTPNGLEDPQRIFQRTLI